MTNEDDVMTALLKAAGARETLPPELESKWKTQFEAALGPVVRRRRVRRRFAAASVASLALIAFLIAKGLAPRDTSTIVAAVSHSSSADVAAGMQLFAGDTIDTGRGRVALRYGGNDVRIDTATTVRADADALTLVRGSLYVDTLPFGAPGAPIRIETPSGTVTHVGTQFVVAADGGSLFVAVREGHVMVADRGDTFDVSADATTAGVVELRDGVASTRRIVRHGGPWEWVTQDVAAPLSLDGRSAAVFLAWYARETGRVLRYEDARVEAAASATLLHGIGGVALADALGTVAAITRLRVEPSPTDDSLRVASELDQHAD